MGAVQPVWQEHSIRARRPIPARTDVSRRDSEMKLETLKELYVEELKDLYSAENQILKALPEMAKAAGAPDLKAGFEEHLKQTREHVSRLEQIFDGLGK